jgi:DNA replication protein DnaC/primosomal protein DnaI
MLWVSHEPCGCPGEVEQAEKQAAYEAAERLEEDRKRLTRAGIARRYLDAEISDPICLAYVKSYPAGRGIGLYIHGRVGTWKSTNASGIARTLLLSGRTVIMTSALKILSDVRETFDSRSSAKEELDRYLRCEVLVLDDLGKESASPWSVMTLFDVVNTRYEAMLPTIYTSQYDLESLGRRLSRAHERETADAIVSRIRETCIDVGLYGPDKRRPPVSAGGQRRADAPPPPMTRNAGGQSELGRFGDSDT